MPVFERTSWLRQPITKTNTDISNTDICTVTTNAVEALTDGALVP